MAFNVCHPSLLGFRQDPAEVFGLKQYLVALAALVAASATTPVEDVVSTCDGMRALKILPTIFAVTY